MEKRGVMPFILAAALVLFAFASLLLLSSESVLTTGNVIYTPQNCSGSEIANVWNEVFAVEYGDASFISYDVPETPGCDYFIAVRTIDGVQYNLLDFRENYTAEHGYSARLLSASAIDVLVSAQSTAFRTLVSDSSNEARMQDSENRSVLFVMHGFGGFYANERATSLDSQEAHVAEFEVHFARNATLIADEHWFADYSLSLTDIEGYTYNTNITYPSLQGIYSGNIYSDVSSANFLYIEGSPLDFLSEGLSLALPEPLNSSTNDEEMQEENLSLMVFVDGDLHNNSRSYSDVREINIADSNDSRVLFDWNFSEDSLNISAVEVKTQTNQSLLGYTIVNGIAASKTVYVDKINPLSVSVCVKHAHVASISEVSNLCNEPDETLVSCPGSQNNLTCLVTNSQFVVSGLTSSAVVESTYSGNATAQTNTSCVPNWECSEWLSCSFGIQARTCVDTNFCNTVDGRPITSQACTTICTSNWQCDSWWPLECGRNETQYRTCADLHLCADTLSKPDELQACEFEGLSVVWRGVLIVSIVLVLVIIGAGIFLYYRHKQLSKAYR